MPPLHTALSERARASAAVSQGPPLRFSTWRIFPAESRVQEPKCELPRRDADENYPRACLGFGWLEVLFVQRWASRTSWV